MIEYNKNLNIVLLIGVMLLAVNLRPAITSIGPIIGIIREDIGFSSWNVAFLTSLPLIMFAFISFLTPRLTRIFSLNQLILTSLLFLIIGIILRSVSLISNMIIGTILIGIGIAICNVLVPSIIKMKFPLRLMLLTSLYSTFMGISATLASGLSVPIAVNFNGGWEVALIVWSIPAVAALIYWIALFFYKDLFSSKVSKSDNKFFDILNSHLAWKIALFMGCHSLLFYIIVSWISEIFYSLGMNEQMSGYLLSYLQLIGLPASLIVPLIANKLKEQSGIVVVLNIFLIIGILILIVFKGQPMFFVAATLIGFSISGNFTLALLFLSLRTINAKQTTDLSGMAQTIGYSLAAFGPILIGFIYDFTENWNISLFIIIGLALISSLLGLSVGKKAYI